MKSKEDKKGLKRYLTVIIITALVSFAVAFVLVYFWLAGDAKYLKLKEMDLFIGEFYGEVDEEKIADGVIRGYLSGLDDKYAGYYTAKENEERSDRLDGQAVGIGIIVVKHPKNDSIYVKHVYDNCPAAKSGLKDGDEIIAIDGVSVKDCGYEKAVDSILREVGSKVDLLILREGKKISVTVEYSRFAAQSVFAKMIGNYGYIEITSFNAESVAQFKNAVNLVKEQGAKGLIFDLRGNGGGTVDSVTQILDFLMPEGVLMSVKYGNGKTETYAKSDADEIDIPMAVLIDNQTASASELFSANVRDFNKGVLIGTKTYGKGVMQGTFGFTDGSASVFTIAEFFPNSGVSFNGEGLSPDIEVELTDEQKVNFHILSDEMDPVKQAAIRWLSGE